MRRKINYSYGDRRIKCEFLWFPTFSYFDEISEWRWLEWAWCERKYLNPGWSFVYHWADGPNDFHYVEDRREVERGKVDEPRYGGYQ